MQFDTRFQLETLLINEEADDIIIKFTLRGITTGFNISIQSNEDLDTLPFHKITSHLFWDPKINPHAVNEVAVQQGAGITKRQRLFIGIDGN